ncbi:hypothetical protein RND81_01G159900 [Saponaria officinalis]|uniref:Uncharacterized protein n=1 Tax=Saponaria officinalis TaxID=3572 RepID=A0AAW1NF71_SAPOF
MGARKLSYAGRVVLIQSVLTHLHSYWARIFILPIAVIKKVESICNAYLWEGQEHNTKVSRVSWDKVCQSKKHGGLGFLNGKVRNVANVGKLVWWVVQKKDLLWVKWIHCTYLKSHYLLSYSPGQNTSSAWRGVCKAMELIRGGLLAPGGLRRGIIIRWLLGIHGYSPHNHGLSGLRLSRISVTSPSISSLVGYLCRNVYRQLIDCVNGGVCTNRLCFLCCNADECHLFFRCEYGCRCVQLLGKSVGVSIPSSNVDHWWRNTRWDSLKTKHAVGALVIGLIYHVWMKMSFGECYGQTEGVSRLFKSLY